jgi:hypothetical protein
VKKLEKQEKYYKTKNNYRFLSLEINELFNIFFNFLSSEIISFLNFLLIFFNNTFSLSFKHSASVL